MHIHINIRMHTCIHILNNGIITLEKHNIKYIEGIGVQIEKFEGDIK